MIDKEWDDFVENEKSSGILHDRQFIELLSKEWKCTPCHKVVDTNDGKMAVPAYIIDKSIFGKKITTQPFLYFPKLLGKIDEQKAIQYLISEAKKLGKNWAVEYKSENDFSIETKQKFGIKTINPYIYSTLFLENTYEEQTKKYQKQFSKDLRRNLRRIEKENIIIKHAETEEEVKQFYIMLCKLYKNKHKIFCQPENLFLNIFRELNEKVEFIIATKNKEVLAGIVAFKKKNNWDYSWGTSSLTKFRALSLNSLLIDSMVKEGISKKIKTVSFGASGYADKSLLMHKKHWGCVEQPIYYHYWNIDPNFKFAESNYKNLRNTFQIIPLPIFKKISKKMIPRLI